MSECTSPPEKMSAKRSGSLFNAPAIIAIALWSGMSPFAKYALDYIPEFAYLAIRPIIVSGLIFLFLRLRRTPLGIARADRGRMLLSGAVGLGASQTAYILGLARTSVSHTAILLATSPLLMALYRIGRGRRPSARALLGIAVGFAGVVTLVAGSNDTGDASIVGDLIVLGGAVAWIGATIWPAPLLETYGSLKVTGWLFFTSMLVTLPFGIAAAPALARSHPPALAWVSLIYAAVFGNLAGNTLWQRAVGDLGASRTMIYIYLEPVGSIVLATTLLGEPFTLLQGIGAALALGGVALVGQ